MGGEAGKRGGSMRLLQMQMRRNRAAYWGRVLVRPSFPSFATRSSHLQQQGQVVANAEASFAADGLEEVEKRMRI